MAMNLQSQLEQFKGWSEVLKNIAQICAIIVAGWWTYHKFIKTEAPSLELRADVMSNVNWVPSSNPEYCQANFRIQVENSGKSSFDLGSIHVRAWKFDVPANENAAATSFDNDQIKKGPTFFDRTFRTAPTGHYAPGVKGDGGFNIAVSRSTNSLVLFSADLLSDDQVIIRTTEWQMAMCDTGPQ